MHDECKLKLANGISGIDCEQEQCSFWRIVTHLGVTETGVGCAIQHFQLLDGGSDVAEWLLTVKERLEALPTDEEG